MIYKSKWILPFILILVTLAFLPSLFNGFIKNDDPTHLLENVTLRALTFENVRAMFQSIVNVTYIPLTTLSFAIEYHFFGYNPFIYHLDNLLLHLGVVVCVYVFLQRLGLSVLAAGISALFFGIHPLRVESVAWITERKDVLYGIFYMLAVLQYWDYAKSGKRNAYFVSLIFGFLSILAKPMALSLPLIFLLCDWWMGRKWKWNVFLEKIPYAVIIIPITWITYALNARNPIQSVGEAFLLWVWCFVFYVRKLIFPGELNIFYQYPKPFSLAQPEFALSLAAFFLIIFLVYYFRKFKIVVFAVLFYFFSIFFLLRFDDVENINPVSDRFMYLPSIGFSALFGMGLAWLLEHHNTRIKQAGRVLGLILIVATGAVTFQQCREWRDGAILWSVVIKRSPNLALAYVHRGSAYQERGDYISAIADYEKAIALKDDPYAHSNLAMIYKERKEFAKALVEYGKAVALRPNYWGWYFDRGNLYRETGQLQSAINDYTTTLQLLPGYAEAYGNRGIAYFLSQKDDLALADFNRAIRFDSHDINSINNRAVIYAKRQDFKAAIEDFTRLIVLEPLRPELYFNRGLAYSDNHQYDLAINDFNKALSLNPGYTAALEMKNRLKH